MAVTLRSHVRRLRQALGPRAGARITACDPGYLISVGEPELDVLGFGAACADAGAARRAPRWPEASAAAGRAVELWRGTPLLDVPSQVLFDLAADLAGVAGERCGPFGFDLAGPFGDGLGVGSGVESGLGAGEAGVAVVDDGAGVLAGRDYPQLSSTTSE